MVDERLQKLLYKYNVTVASQSNSNATHSTTLISNSNHELQIHIRYVNGEIYLVAFMNNDFFEISTNDLYTVVHCILDASYLVEKRGYIKKNKMVVITSNTKNIYPEQVHDDSMYKNTYEYLPTKWDSLRNTTSHNTKNSPT